MGGLDDYDFSQDPKPKLPALDRGREVTADNVRLAATAMTVAVMPDDQPFTEEQVEQGVVEQLCAVVRDLVNMTDLEEIMDRLSLLHEGYLKITDEVAKHEKEANSGEVP